jgi:hypothetical protein
MSGITPVDGSRGCGGGASDTMDRRSFGQASTTQQPATSPSPGSSFGRPADTSVYGEAETPAAPDFDARLAVFINDQPLWIRDDLERALKTCPRTFTKLTKFIEDFKQKTTTVTAREAHNAVYGLCLELSKMTDEYSRDTILMVACMNIIEKTDVANPGISESASRCASAANPGIQINVSHLTTTTLAYVWSYALMLKANCGGTISNGDRLKIGGKAAKLSIELFRAKGVEDRVIRQYLENNPIFQDSVPMHTGFEDVIREELGVYVPIPHRR